MCQCMINFSSFEADVCYIYTIYMCALCIYILGTHDFVHFCHLCFERYISSNLFFFDYICHKCNIETEHGYFEYAP